MNDRKDEEENRLSARAARYVRVGANVGAVAARVAGQRLLGFGGDDAKNAAALAAALGGLKGPIMKVAQLLATIPEALPAEYAQELSQLQSQAPPMGPAFVRRRMMAELGPDWAARFKSFETQPAASASLGQVHRAVAHDGRALAVKLQYPDMQSAVEADLNQLKVVFALHARMNPAVDTGEILKEVSARLREELDYELEAAPHGALRADLQGRAPHPRAGGAGRAVDQAPADHDLARRPQAARLQGGAAGGSQRHRAGDVQGVVVSVLALRRDPRRPASRQLHDLRAGQRRRCQRRAGQAGRHQPARLRLHPHVPDAVRAGRDRSLQRAAARQARPGGARLRDLGVRRPVQRADRHLEHLGAVHLRAAARRPRARDRRRHHAGPVRAQGSLHRAQAAQGEGAGAGAARVRVHGPGGDRARRRVPAPGRQAQLAQHVQRDHRGLRAGRGGGAAEGGVCRGGRAAADAREREGRGGRAWPECCCERPAARCCSSPSCGWCGSTTTALPA